MGDGALKFLSLDFSEPVEHLEHPLATPFSFQCAQAGRDAGGNLPRPPLAIMTTSRRTFARYQELPFYLLRGVATSCPMFLVPTKAVLEEWAGYPG